MHGHGRSSHQANGHLAVFKTSEAGWIGKRAWDNQSFRLSSLPTGWPIPPDAIPTVSRNSWTEPFLVCGSIRPARSDAVALDVLRLEG
jgi:hypothetical protein